MSVTERRYGRVNHERVRVAMADVGTRLEAERRERVAVEQAEVRARGGRICGGTDWRLNVRCEWAAVVSLGGMHRCWWHVDDLATAPPAAGSRFGPHRVEDAPTTVEVLPRGKWPSPVLVAVPLGLVRQRQQMNDLAHRTAHPTPGGTA